MSVPSKGPRMQNGDLSRREREKLNHRREILEAAERAFVRDGYQLATMERIAREADFAVGTLYNFFKSKEELFDEVIASLGDEAFAVLEKRVFQEADPRAAVEALIEVRLLYPQQHRDFARVFFEVAPSSPPAALSGSLPEKCQPLYRRYLESVTEVLSRGITAGVFREEDPLYMALCLEGAFGSIGTHWIQEEWAEPLPERVAKASSILLGMVCRSQHNSLEGSAE